MMNFQVVEQLNAKQLFVADLDQKVSYKLERDLHEMPSGDVLAVFVATEYKYNPARRMHSQPKRMGVVSVSEERSSDYNFVISELHKVRQEKKDAYEAKLAEMKNR